jgi:hypothetical protein
MNLKAYFFEKSWGRSDNHHLNNFPLILARPVMEGARRLVQGSRHEPKGTSKRAREESQHNTNCNNGSLTNNTRGGTTMLQGQDIDFHYRGMSLDAKKWATEWQFSKDLHSTCGYWVKVDRRQP